MTNQQTIHGMKRLEAAYSKKFSKEQVDIWIDIFKEMKAERFYEYVNAHIKTSPFFPVVSNIWEISERSDDAALRKAGYSKG